MRILRVDRSHEGCDTTRYYGPGQHRGYVDHQGKWRSIVTMSSYRQSGTSGDLATGRWSKHHTKEREQRQAKYETK